MGLTDHRVMCHAYHSMEITATMIKELRDKSGVSIGKCKEALIEASGNMDKAHEVLKSYSAKAALKKADRDLGAGTITSYIHSNRSIGTLLELMCETDFVARNEDFLSLANDIAMHITAMGSSSDTLIEEPFVKNPDLTIATLLQESMQKLGERIEVGRFNRFEVLEKSE
ncbi:MAG: elongation factor Ts [Planctomycetota bacterium]|jgi:elongation factor Ts